MFGSESCWCGCVWIGGGWRCGCNVWGWCYCNIFFELVFLDVYVGW